MQKRFGISLSVLAILPRLPIGPAETGSVSGTDNRIAGCFVDARASAILFVASEADRVTAIPVCEISSYRQRTVDSQSS
jgi:hypothetical protein